jgi:hypothetical protein
MYAKIADHKATKTPKKKKKKKACRFVKHASIERLF